jgi:hypothetical protein
MGARDPATLVQLRIDSALSAEIEASAALAMTSAEGTPASARGSVPGAFPPLAVSVLMVLLGALLIARGRAVRGHTPPEGAGMAREGQGAAEAEAPPRPCPPAAPPVKPIVLPAHVVAMLQRAEERRLAAAAPGDAQPPPEPRRTDPGGRAHRSHVDVWIGR